MSNTELQTSTLSGVEGHLKEIDNQGLPSGWKECKLGDVITLQRGHDLPKTKMKEGIYPVAGSNGIIGYHNEYTTNEKGITIGRSGNIGNPKFYNCNFWAHNTVLYIKDFKGNDEKFIFYFLNNIDFSGLNSGSAVPTLNRNYVHETNISLPPLPEQKAIAEILSSFDDKIDLLHQQNKTLEDMAQTLFREWFVEKTDERWGEGKLNDEFDFIMGVSPKGDTFNSDKTGTPMFQGNADFNFRFPSNRIYTNDPKKFADKYDTLISVRAPVGAQNMAKEKCCIGRGLASFKYKKCYEFYTYTYYKMMSLMTEIKSFNNNGTVFGSISKSEFNNIDVVIPNIEAIERFEETAKPINDKIIQNEEQIKTLEQTRDTLLPKLMSGEVRV